MERPEPAQRLPHDAEPGRVAVGFEVAGEAVDQRAEKAAGATGLTMRRVGAEENIHPLRGGADFDPALHRAHVREGRFEDVLAHRVVAVAHR